MLTIACTSPSRPSPMQPPDIPTTFALHIQASQSVCTTNTVAFPRDGYMVRTEYLLQFMEAGKSTTSLGASVTTYQYEPFRALRDEVIPTNVTLQITRSGNSVSGLLSGSALAGAIDTGDIVSIHSVRFSSGSGGPVTLQGNVSGPTQMRGTFAGTIGWTVYKYSLGGRCTAPDHGWILEQGTAQ